MTNIFVICIFGSQMKLEPDELLSFENNERGIRMRTTFETCLVTV